MQTLDPLFVLNIVNLTISLKFLSYMLIGFNKSDGCPIIINQH